MTAMNKRGFTIIELMIATTVLATILVLVSAMMIGIGRLYYKGINQARVQDTARTITDDVAQHLQLSVKEPLSQVTPLDLVDTQGNHYTANAYCIENTRYSYVLKRQIGSDNDADGQARIKHVLWRDSIPPTGCDPADLSQDQPSSSGSELMIANSRLTDFTIGLTSPYSLSVSVAYGDRDLLNLSDADTSCKGGAGQQFCATSALKTVVVRRISSSD